MVQAILNFPDTFLTATKTKKENLNRFVKESVAAELYREGRLSLGKAAELAETRNKWEMLTILDKKGVPINYSAFDAIEDLKTLKEVLGRE